jgi:EutQ-like cupin domain
MATMATIEVKNFEAPDETRPFDGNGYAEVVNVAGRTVGRGVFEPGWRWSANVKPIAGTDSCQVSHLGYVISGRMKIYADDGTESEIGPGDVYAIRPGHDAETIGDEPCIALDFGEFGEYAKRH